SSPTRRRGRRAGPESGAQLRDMAFARVLVVPPAQQLGSVADALAGYVIERHLHDQLRPQSLPDELLVGLPAARLARAALARPVRLQLAEQLALLLRLEARGVAHDVQSALVVVHPEDERAERALLLAE